MNDGIEKLVDLAATDYRGLVARRLRLFSLYAAAAMFGLLTVVALAGAAGVWLADRYGAVTALLLVSAAMLAIGLAFALTAMIMKRSQMRTEEMLRRNRRIAVVGALSLLAGRSSRRPTTLLVVIGAIFALRRLLLGRS